MPYSRGLGKTTSVWGIANRGSRGCGPSVSIGHAGIIIYAIVAPVLAFTVQGLGQIKDGIATPVSGFTAQGLGEINDGIATPVFSMAPGCEVQEAGRERAEERSGNVHAEGDAS